MRKSHGHVSRSSGRAILSWFLDRVATGQIASVKYDPANPGNSILVAEDWSGLH